jgi:hypothetical protein
MRWLIRRWSEMMSGEAGTKAEWIHRVLGVSISPRPDPLSPDPLSMEYDRRWQLAQPRLLNVIKAQTGDTSRIRAVAAFVQESVESGQFKAALEGLDRLEPLLASGQTDASAPALSLVKLQQARLTWETTRATVRQYLRTLESSVLSFFEERSEFPTAQEAVRRFGEVTEELDEALIDSLDDALNEADPERRRELLDEARDCIEDYEDFVHTSDLVAAIDANPFTKVGIRDTVLSTAAQLRTALG